MPRISRDEHPAQHAWTVYMSDKKSRADISAEYMIRHAQETPARNAGLQEADTTPVLIVTTNDIPGQRITQVHGDVFGLVVRARNVFSNIGASMRTLVGGEAGGYTTLLAESRNQARERMWQEARARGANAVVGMRFDCSEIGDVMSEIVAYGTAVTVEAIDAQSISTAPSDA